MEADAFVIEQFINLFQGSTKCYGQHTYGKLVKGKKEQGGKSWTVTNAVGKEQYLEHLTGKIGLGISPITSDNKCKYCVIDIDSYNRANYRYLQSCINSIKDNALPLVAFRSKSGGIHLYLFFTEFIPVDTAINYATEFAFVFGLFKMAKEHTSRKLELFPKQRKASEKGGNWVNLPYGKGAKGITCALVGDKELTLEEAIMHIKDRQKSGKDIQSIIDNLFCNDGPPSLQTLYYLNDLEDGDGRNKYIFNMGIYLKAKYKESLDIKMYEVNDHLKHPLDDDEVEKTIKSVRDGDYNYRLYDEPMAQFRDDARGRERTFGVGADDGYFSNLEFGDLEQIKMEKPYYHLHVKKYGDPEFKKLTLYTTKDMIDQKKFLELCVEQLHFYPTELKLPRWKKQVNALLKNIIITDVPEEDDTSPRAILKQHFYDFILKRTQANTVEEINHDRVYFDGEDYFFKRKHFLAYLENQRFKGFKPGQIHEVLRSAGSKEIRLFRGSLRCNKISSKDFDNFSFNAANRPELEPNFEDKNEEENKTNDYNEEPY